MACGSGTGELVAEDTEFLHSIIRSTAPPGVRYPAVGFPLSLRDSEVHKHIQFSSGASWEAIDKDEDESRRRSDKTPTHNLSAQ